MCSKDLGDFVFLMTSREKSHDSILETHAHAFWCPAQPCICHHQDHSAQFWKAKQSLKTTPPPAWVQMFPPTPPTPTSALHPFFQSLTKSKIFASGSFFLCNLMTAQKRLDWFFGAYF